jgi:hypothetical protein
LYSFSFFFVVDIISSLQNLTIDDLFSPPPLPTNNDDQSVSNEETSDDGSDIFASSKKERKPLMTSHIIPDEFVDKSLKDDG